MADCRLLPTACEDFESTLSQHAAFKNGRCLETPLCERCASRRSVAACRCLHRRGAGFSPRRRRRPVVGTLPSLGATLPLPRCQPRPSSVSVLNWPRLPSSACIGSRQAAPAMAAAASGATERPVQSAHAGARMHEPFQCFPIAKHTGSSTTKRLVPTTYTVHSPITIAHAWREPVMHF